MGRERGQVHAQKVQKDGVVSCAGNARSIRAKHITSGSDDVTAAHGVCEPLSAEAQRVESRATAAHSTVGVVTTWQRAPHFGQLSNVDSTDVSNDVVIFSGISNVITCGVVVSADDDRRRRFAKSETKCVSLLSDGLC